MLKKLYRKIRNSVVGGLETGHDLLPPEKIRAASMSPVVKYGLQKFSEEEYDRNPNYQLVIENLVNHTIGPHPKIIANSQVTGIRDSDNDLVEDAYLEWLSNNGIAKAYRELRRQAALTGIGIAIPFWDKRAQDELQVPIKYRVFGGRALQSPRFTSWQDRIINGVEYDEDWEPKKFYIVDNDYEFLVAPNINEVKEYDARQVLYWCRTLHKSIMWPLPECYAAFTMYPYIRRFLEATLKKHEFLSSMPMAVELDAQVYSTYAAAVRNTSPEGNFEYQPGMIPTLKPGMKLSSMPMGMSAKESREVFELFACTCASTVQMPKNLALMNSDDSNMASAQVDIQPWSVKVNIDRFDLEPVFRRSFHQWWELAKYQYVSRRVQNLHPTFYPHTYIYQDMFEHPDPSKRAKARETDLKSGAVTLNRLYSQMGLNFRREINREAESLGISPEQLIQIYISSRTTSLLQTEEEPNDEVTPTR